VKKKGQHGRPKQKHPDDWYTGPVKEQTVQNALMRLAAGLNKLQQEKSK